MGNGEAKDLGVGERMLLGWECRVEGDKGEKKMRQL